MSFRRRQDITNQVTDNSASDGLTLNSRNFSFYIKGDFGGGEAAVEVRGDIGGWLPLLTESGSPVTFTSDAVRPLTADANDVRFVVSGATTPSLRAMITILE